MIEKLIKALKEDEGYYYCWQANIAMAFYDEYRRVFPKDEDTHNTILEVSNDAAKHFLNMLIKDD